MHVYIYDSFLNHAKYNKILSQIETRITDLGLNGKISRMGLMKNSEDVVQNEIKRGAKTIIAVGNDSTIQKLAGSMANTNVPLGIIGIDKKNNFIAEKFGISLGEEACDVLSARRIENIDLAMINNYYFISSINISSKNTIIAMQDSYSIEVSDLGEILIVNLPTNDINLPDGINYNPQDGLLQLVINTNQNKKFSFKNNRSESVFSFNSLEISNKDNTLVIDNNISIASPAKVGIMKQALKIIVGKNRAF